MKSIKIDPNKITRQEINLIVGYLQSGKIIVYPTDTIYGLGCLATNKKAIEKIYKIKQRSKSKPLLILISSFVMLKKYCYVNKKQYEFLRTVWPGPVSTILRKRKLLPNELTGGGVSVAVRLPKNDFLIKIIRGIGKPIISTSLNISGQKNIVSLDNLENYFKEHKPDLVIDAGKVSRVKPSKLIDLRDVDNINVLRN